MKTIVQIGVERANDHVYEMISSSKEEIFAIFVEPNPHCIPVIEQKYSFLKNKIISNVAISDKDGTEIMYFPPWFTIESNVSSLDPQHLVNHGINRGSIVSLEVKSFKLTTFLSSVLTEENTVIDNLFIDTEGFDCDIILSTDFSSLKIKNICFEYIHSDKREIIEISGSPLMTPKYLETEKHLLNSGFVLDRVELAEHNIYFKNLN